MPTKTIYPETLNPAQEPAVMAAQARFDAAVKNREEVARRLDAPGPLLSAHLEEEAARKAFDAAWEGSRRAAATRFIENVTPLVRELASLLKQAQIVNAKIEAAREQVPWAPAVAAPFLIANRSGDPVGAWRQFCRQSGIEGVL